MLPSFVYKNLMAQAAMAVRNVSGNQTPVFFLVVLAFLIQNMALVLIILLVFFGASYLWFSVCLFFMAKKTNTRHSWLAFIPLLNLYTFCKTAGKSGAWIFLMLIPLVNIFIFLILWVNVARRLKRSGAWAILSFIPGLNFLMMGFLAFSEVKSAQENNVLASNPAPSKKPAQAQQKTEGPKTALAEQERKFCPQCGNRADPKDEFCSLCGESIPDQEASLPVKKFCSHCGADILKDDKFCPGCGQAL